ncbi:hypothetical protein MKW92_047298 [Papaver armeniacum]|nr:hypothetical protein MKW92_047298 [Papaver armeniacum]
MACHLSAAGFTVSFRSPPYAGNQPSVDAIESAHNKIIMQKFHERRRPKLNIKKKVRDVSNFFNSFVFVILVVLTVLYPLEEEPTLQVAISLLATIYFIYDRLLSRMRAFLYGVGVFVVSWLLGTFLMVFVIPPVIRGLRSLENDYRMCVYGFLLLT